jgi:hypothetical protein
MVTGAEPGGPPPRSTATTLTDLVKPTLLFPGSGEDLTQRTPEPQRAVCDRHHRSTHPTPSAVPQQIGPGLGRLPVAIGQRDQLLAAIRADTDHHQKTQLVLDVTTLSGGLDPTAH